MKSSSGSLGRRAPLEGRIEVRDQHVVGLDRLEAARDEAPSVVLEHDRRRGEANRAVGRRRLSLQLGGRPRGGARLGTVALVGLRHLGVVEPRDDRVGVDARHRLQHGTELLVVVEHEAGREVRELQRAEDTPLVARIREPCGDDRPAAARGRADALLRVRRERHAVAAEAQLPERAAKRRVPACDVLRGVLREADHDESPRELLAVAPVEHAQRGDRRVRPGAAGVVVERELDHGVLVAAPGVLVATRRASRPSIKRPSRRCSDPGCRWRAERVAANISRRSRIVASPRSRPSARASARSSSSAAHVRSVAARTVGSPSTRRSASPKNSSHDCCSTRRSSSPVSASHRVPSRWAAAARAPPATWSSRADDELGQQLLLRLELPVDARDAGAGGGGDGRHRRVESLAREDRGRRREQLLLLLLRGE